LHIGLHQFDAGLVFRCQAADAVSTSPLQHGGVDIDADRLVLGSLAHPLACGTCRPAEILAEQVGGAPAQLLKSRLHELYFILDILYGRFVELMEIGLLGHCRAVRHLGRFQAHRRLFTQLDRKGRAL
jgi:hypothetical protein